MYQSKKYLRKALMPIALVMKDQRRSQPVSCFKKSSSLLRGFISESAILYGISQKNYRDYLSDYQLMKTGDINKEAAYFLNDKVAFTEMVEGVVGIPQTLAVINEGRLISKHPDLSDAPSVWTYLQAEPGRRLVIKPIFGAEGRGVALVYWDDNQVVMNDEKLSESEFIDYLAGLDKYFISDFIQQGEFSQSLFSKSLNTIRMLTMIDPITQDAFIGASTFRVGTNLSAPTDNFRRHGLSVDIDPRTGRLNRAAMIPEEGKVTWHQWHPNTGNQLTGREIPEWDKVKEDILKLANFVYQDKGIAYVGWDVVLTDQGISLLEGNSWPGVSLHQVHHPLLANPKVKAFYQYYNAVK